MADQIEEEIQKEVKSHKILIYGKGTKTMPMCGFTRETMQFFDKYGYPYELIDVLSQPAKREALTKMVEGRTSLVIAHRLSTVQRADKIVVMHKSKVREMGSHQQLLAQRGIYYKLYQLQYKDQEIPILPTEPTVQPGAVVGDD